MSDDNRQERTDEQVALSIREVVIRLLEGTTLGSDKELWDALIRLQNRRLSEIAVRMRLPPHLIDDLIQGVWAKILRKWDSLRRRGGARRFVGLTATMMHNAVVDAFRHRDQHRAESLDSLQDEWPDRNANDPADSRMAKEQREWVAAGLEKLENTKPKYAWLLRELFLKERPIEEVAEEMKVTKHALHCLKGRALKELGRLLSRLETDGEAAP